MAGGGGGYGLGSAIFWITLVVTLILLGIIGGNIYLHLKLATQPSYREVFFWIVVSISTLSLLSLWPMGVNLLPLIIPMLHLILAIYQYRVYSKL